MKVTIACLRASMQNFRSAERGNVAIIFACVLFPLLGFVGACVDYGYASLVRTHLAAALDATALMLSKNAASQTTKELQASAEEYFRANFNYPDVQQPTIVATYSSAPAPTLSLSGATSVNTFIMGIMGVDKIDISADTKVKWGKTRLRVALALDVTGSMLSAGKMTALKTAAKSFLTQMQNAATNNGDVYVSIIPFNKDVNVGSSNYKQSWVGWNLWDEVNGKCSRREDDNNTRTKCLNDGGNWNADNHNKWSGCVMDRDMLGGDYDTKNTAPSTPATLFPAEEYSSCPEQLMALSFDWAALKNKIDALQAKGNTNQAIGLAWAFQSLTEAPFTIPPKDPSYNYEQVIILMTDGANTASRHYPVGPAASIDARERILCRNVKDAGITIYTVQVATDGWPKSTMLEQCASDPDQKFFLLTSAGDIVTTFNKIATDLKSAYIAQ